MFEKLSSNATEPTKRTKGSAGFDISSAYDYVIPKRSKALVLTDIAIQIPLAYL